MKKHGFAKCLPRWMAAGVCTVALCTGVNAQVQKFDIAPGDLGVALKAFAAQTGAQLNFKEEDVKGRATKGLQSEMSPSEALQALLEGTPLKIRNDPAQGGALYVELAEVAPALVESDAESLATVIVTATRRNEPVQKVPMQIDVVKATDLSRAGASNLRDYVANQPGVNVTTYGGAASNDISIRGVSTGLQSTATVGIYVDEVATGSSSALGGGTLNALNMALMDLNHVEVLRGPQGTLYGAGAMGGVLKYVTNEPQTDEFSGNVMMSASAIKDGGTNYTLSGVVNVPLQQDVAAFRVSAFKDRYGGSVGNVGPGAGADVDRGDSWGARASLLVTPIRKLAIRVTALTQKIDRDGKDYVEYDPATQKPVLDGRLRSTSIREPSSSKTSIFSADIEYDFGWARLNSITTSQRGDADSLLDLTSFYGPPLAGAGLNFKDVGSLQGISLRKTTQEFRITSKSDKHFEWLAGFYFNKEKSTNDTQSNSTPAPGTPDLNLFSLLLNADYKEIAGYGDVTWKFDSGLSVTAGARYAKNKQKSESSTSGIITGVPVGTLVANGESRDTSRLWLLTAGYALDTNNSVYLRGASGYRPGGPNFVALDANGHPNRPPMFQHDTLTSYEAGYKANLLDRRMQLEAAVYRINWQDIQQITNIDGVGGLDNGGKARINGAELTVTYRPNESWVLSANGAYIDAKLSEGAVGLGAVAGSRLPNSARFSGGVSANYKLSLADHPSYVGATVRHVGQRDAGYGGSTTLPSYGLPAYTLVDMQGGIEFGSVGLNLFVRNLFDKSAQLGAYTATLLAGGPAWVTVAQPRTVGFNLTVPF